MDTPGEIRFTASIEAGRAILTAASKDAVVSRLREALQQLVRGDHTIVIANDEHGVQRLQVHAGGPMQPVDERLLGYLATVASAAWDGDVTSPALQRIEAQLCDGAALAAVGAMAARYSHLLNNAIGVILGHVQLLQRDEQVVPPAQALAAVERQARRCADLSTALSQLAQSVSVDRQRLAPELLLQRVLRSASRLAHQRGVALLFEAPAAGSTPTVALTQPRIDGALLGLTTNAIEASPRGGRVTLGARADPHQDRQGVLLTVADMGHGIDPEHQRQLFAPFFTTKPSGQGAGLGLFLARQVVELHGGTLTLDSTRAGTTARVWLPA